MALHALYSDSRPIGLTNIDIIKITIPIPYTVCITVEIWKRLHNAGVGSYIRDSNLCPCIQ